VRGWGAYKAYVLARRESPSGFWVASNGKTRVIIIITGVLPSSLSTDSRATDLDIARSFS
jgi:hypothetical protein